MNSKPQAVVEYRDVNDTNRSRTTVLARGVDDSEASRNNPYRFPHEWTLTHHLAGYECAGSMARWTKERWSVRFMADGALHGRSFLTEHEARGYFAEQTGKGGA